MGNSNVNGEHKALYRNRSKAPVGKSISVILLMGLFIQPVSISNHASDKIVIAVFAFLVIFLMNRSTEYVIKEKKLIIRYCYLFVFKVSIEQIKSLNIISSPIDCGIGQLNDVVIILQNEKKLTIAPKKQKEFIRAICIVNNAVEIKH